MSDKAPLPSGRYYIRNDGAFAGSIESFWDVELLDNGRHILKIGGAPTQDINKVVSFMINGEPAEEWVITERGDDGYQKLYTIQNKSSADGWIARKSAQSPQIAVGPLIADPSNPPQFHGSGLWNLQRLPKILWIGCSDPRVSESVGQERDHIFVQRNIANQFHITDTNAIAVLTFAVVTLGVEAIWVVGHTRCAGVHACFEAANGRTVAMDPVLWKWLGPLRVLADSFKSSEKDLTIENIRDQVRNVEATLRRLGKRVEVEGRLFNVDTPNTPPTPIQ